MDPAGASVPLPLVGIRVLEFGQFVLAPYAGFLLAMAGAEVIKIEPPEGEAIRRAGEPMAYMFELLNAGKQSLSIDLKLDGGRSLIHRLAPHADVVLENFAPGVMDRLGIGVGSLQEINPRLVFASASGFGQDGSRRDEVAMDGSVQAMIGLLATTGETNGLPMRAGLPIADFMSGTALYGAIVTALIEARATGRGRAVDIAMLEVLFPSLTIAMNDWFVRGRTPPPRYGNGHPFVIPQGAFAVNDGWIFLMCASDQQWIALAEEIDVGLAADPRFATRAARAAHRAELERKVGGWAAGQTREEALAACRRRRIPASAIREPIEIIADEPLRARNFLHDIKHPTLGDIPVFASPLRFSGSAPKIPSPAAQLGEHNASLLARLLGLCEGELGALGEQGVLGSP